MVLEILEHPALVAIMFYLIFCTVIAVAFIGEVNRWEHNTQDVPLGDLCYYGENPMISYTQNTGLFVVLCILLFPSTIIVGIWMLICLCINNIIL